LPNSTLFISDIHLSSKNPALADIFFQFLEGPAREAEALYILGDLFDVWVGNDIDIAFQKKVQHALKTLSSQGIKLYFINGNRDFLLSNAFLKEAGCQKLNDPTIIDLHGTPTLLTHGDKLCTQDIAYQRYRCIAQHPLTRFIFLKLPKKTRENISQKLRQKSQQYQRGQETTILDVSLDAVDKLMDRYKVTQMIHGHVHRPKIHTLSINEKAASRIVLGDWYTTGSVIVSKPTGTVLAIYEPKTGLTECA